MHVQLCRNNGAEREGIYRCDIETSAANNGTYETLYAGLYFNGGQWSKGQMYVFFLAFAELEVIFLMMDWQNELLLVLNL